MKADKDVHDILVEFGLECSVDGVSKDMYDKVKSALLNLLLESLPKRKTSDGMPSRDGYNTALDQTSEAIKRLLK